MPSRETGLQEIRARVNPAVLFFILFAVAILALTLVLVLEKEESRDPGIPAKESAVSEKDGEQAVDEAALGTRDTHGREKPDRARVLRAGMARRPPSLEEPISLTGRVILEDGTPAAVAQVKAALIMDVHEILHPENYRSFSTASGAEGRFLFEGVPGGAYALSATRDGLAGHVSFFDNRYRGYLQKWPRSFEIVLKASGGISGRVIGPEGDPVSGALVIPHNMNASSVKTDRSGRFEIQDLEIGRYHLQVRAEGYVQNTIPEVYTGKRDLEIRLAKGGGIRGTITLEGEPVPDVEVFTLGQGSRNTQGFMTCTLSKSDSAGRFLLGPLAKGKYILQVRDKRYSAPGRKDVEIHDGEILDGVEIILKRNGSVSGRVTSKATGESLSDFEVSYHPWPYIGYRKALKPDYTFTDQEGRFVFTSLPPGTFSLGILGCDGYATLVQDNLEIGEGEKKEDLDFQLERGIPFHLNLRGESGEYITGAGINLRRNEDPGPIRIFDPLPEVLETGDGMYVIEGLGSGPFHLTVQRYGWVAKRETFEIEPEAESKSMEFNLSPTIMVQGRVLDPGDLGVEGALVSFRNQCKSLTGTDGSFKAYDVTPGRNHVAVHAEGFLHFNKWIIVEKEQEPLELTLQPEGNQYIAGRVKNDLDAPLPEVKITLTQIGDDYSVVKTEFTDPEGAFRFDGLTEVTAKLEIDKKHGRVIGDYSKVPVGQTNLEIVVERFARLKGRVNDQAGEPVEQFSVYAWTDQGQGTQSTDGSFTNGVFDLRDVSAGQVRISAYSIDVGDGMIGPIAVGPGETIEGIEIVIQPQGTISGIVLDKATREPLAGAKIHVYPYLRRTRRNLQNIRHRTVTGEDGTFTVGDLHPGTTMVAALHPDYCVGMKEGITVIRGQVTGPVEILLSRGAEINGHVYVNGIGRSGINMDISGPEGEYIRTESGKEGYYRLTGMDPGWYHITARLEEGTSGRRTSGKAHVKEGESTTLDLTFIEGASIAGTVTRFGKPVASVAVSATLKQAADLGAPIDHIVSGHATTGEDGTYRIDGLPPGLYTVHAYHSKGEAIIGVIQEVILDQGGAVCHIEMDEAGLGELSGYIFMNGDPVKDARIYARMHYQSRHGKSDDNGFYKLTDMPSGETEVRVSCYSRGSRAQYELSRKIIVTAGESKQEDFNFTTGSSVLLGSITCNGKPASETWVYIHPEAKNSKQPLNIQVYSRDGSYRAEGLLPGIYSVKISKPWTMSEVVEVKAGEAARCDIAYTQGDAALAASVEIPKDGGNAIAYYIYLFKPDACPFEVGKPLDTPTLSQGLLGMFTSPWGQTFRADHLAPGTYDMAAALHKDGIALKLDIRRIILQDGETTEVKLDLRN